MKHFWISYFIKNRNRVDYLIGTPYAPTLDYRTMNLIRKSNAWMKRDLEKAHRL